MEKYKINNLLSTFIESLLLNLVPIMFHYFINWQSNVLSSLTIHLILFQEGNPAQKKKFRKGQEIDFPKKGLFTYIVLEVTIFKIINLYLRLFMYF